MIGICPSLEEDIYKFEQDREDSPNPPNELYTVTTKRKKEMNTRGKKQTKKKTEAEVHNRTLLDTYNLLKDFIQQKVKSCQLAFAPPQYGF